DAHHLPPQGLGQPAPRRQGGDGLKRQTTPRRHRSRRKLPHLIGASMRKTAAVTAGIVALTAAGASLTVSATPASAHAGHYPFVQWSAPDDGQKVSGKNMHIKAKIGFGADGVKSYKVEVLAPPAAKPPRPGYGTICEEEFGGGPSSATIDCVWDTTAYP